MAKTIDGLVTDVRLMLRDQLGSNVDNDFTDDELKTFINDILVEVSDVSPYQVVETALTVENSKLLDISSIDDLLGINKIEYPIGNDPRSYRNFELIDNETIEIDMDSAFSETGEAGTLTGTVTFTSGSATVTGSGTDFDGELAAGYFIKPSSKTRWYRVYSIESDTSLTLEETVKSGDAGVDTADSTNYRDYVARLYCNKLHSVGTSSSTLNAKEEKVVILGGVAKAASQWINRTRELINTAEERLTDNTTIASMAARITQAIDDLTSARTYINKINVGGRPQSDYINTAAREIQNAAAYLNETGGYLREGQHYLGISGQIRQYQAWCDRQTLEYKQSLRSIAKRKVAQRYAMA